ncbi:gamma-glutamylcyclotransferase family protein [Haloferula rosea]|uniref:Gamma-glutamylcyclotransferase family protein n=1 Tax=Haloferula rosea TaxID=490093 RepID=A0A934RE51_9BACT|nr:gamma-glutamylcyclotransferase family protein [Haloferula rosea]MBK1827441.1 gamma-glutamylcyclotransferase [Haloferula rosea]
MACGSKELVFVYGTLRSNASNAFRMKGGELKGVRCVRGHLYQISWYPGLVLDPAGGFVVGEVWEVSKELLNRLDEFEGLPEGAEEGDEYRRVRVEVDVLPEIRGTPEWEQFGGTEDLGEVWVWEWKGDANRATEVGSGDWLDVESPPQKPIFTGIGCAGVLAFTIGVQYLLGIVVDLLPKVAWAEGVDFGVHHAGVLAALCLGGFSLRMAVRRREPGQVFQILMGLSLLFLGFQCIIGIIVVLSTLLSAAFS